MLDDSATHNARESAAFDAAAAEFGIYLGASGCSPNTARAYGHDLTHLRSFLIEQGLEWRALTPARAVDLLIHLRSKRSRRRGAAQHPSLVSVDGERAVPRLSTATINRVLAAVSSFYEWARITDRFEGPSPITRIHDRAAARVSDRHRPFLTGITSRSQTRSPVRLRQIHRLPRPMADPSVDALLAQLRCRRDLAIIRLLLDGGLRPGEVLGLHLTDIAYGKRRVTIRVRFDHPRGVRSKSRTERVVDLHEAVTLEAVSAYVMHERPQDTASPILFLVGGAGRRPLDALSYAALAKMFARACSRAGIRAPWVTPHALRHTHATRMWEAGMRELTLQRRLGHASPDATRMYTRVSDPIVVAEYRRALGLDADATAPAADSA
ncbi:MULTISPECIES: tyrosine-type recombinase/integrase [Brevundimonas]|jgi:integrase|uniref:Tyrosine recombinase XerD n=1 Tax=Brevundimonas mediterranea TaxID=74329 RepID=A0A7Z8Y410_9CAUL|nr:tyrosine-type recombinase/integrase [Brevundimonas mediterranea]VDC50063.1 Tyrosine recombinase XerD [Brevundimonas mediterranea]